MPDISQEVAYPENLAQLVASRMADASFSHRAWDDEGLAALRAHIRQHYRRVQTGVCAYCKHSVSLQSALNCHVEHIAPKSRYLKFIFEPKNLCVICADCNEIKREQEVFHDEPDPVVKGATRQRYPRSTNAFKIVHPHFDVYTDHIKVLNGGFYLDLTTKGHFTIGACRLNRKLREFGWEAPYDDSAVAAAAQRFLETKDPLARAAALDALKGILLVV